MNTLFSFGILLLTAYVVGGVATKIGLPRIVGYIVTGIIFNPNIFTFVHVNLLEQTELLLDVCLAIIAFEVGGSLQWEKIKQSGKVIMLITLFECLMPYLIISSTIVIVYLLFPNIIPGFSLEQVIALSLLLGALASPTDPSASIAVIHQYKAKGKVTNTILGISALDDGLGIILFSISLKLSLSLVSVADSGIMISVAKSFLTIFGSIGVGIAIGLLFNQQGKLLRVTKDSHWIILLIANVIVCYGGAQLLKVDEILAPMVMGIVIVNTNTNQKQIFSLLERYTEELIFLIFFLLSGMHLNILLLPAAIVPVLIVTALRLMGKYSGVAIGAKLSGAEKVIGKYVAGGLIPQGGIVIGLALMVKNDPALADVGKILLNVIMGLTLIHEFIGPVTTRKALTKAGEIIP